VFWLSPDPLFFLLLQKNSQSGCIIYSSARFASYGERQFTVSLLWMQWSSLGACLYLNWILALLRLLSSLFSSFLLAVYHYLHSILIIIIAIRFRLNTSTV
jgi:hypothetical protein